MVTIDLPELLHFNGGRYSVPSAVLAYEWCTSLAKQHYENFPVASILLPKNMRKHVTAIYAFARIADDIADEKFLKSTGEQLSALNFFEHCLREPEKVNGHPIFMALHSTILEQGLSITPFLRLLSAFRQDILFSPLTSWDQVEEYCSNSANPVGELILALNGVRDTRESDAICTGLQVVNFLQDLSRDIPNNRLYIPGYVVGANNSGCIAEACSRCEEYFRKGADVSKLVSSKRLQFELRLIIAGGVKILQECKKLGSKLQQQRPVLHSSDYVCMLTTSILNGNTRLH